MADKKLPFGNNDLTSNLLPSFYQTPANKKFLQATLDQLYKPGKTEKVNGYIGRTSAKATVGSDIFVSAVDQTRQNYQLEPGVSIEDELGNVTFFKDYIDYINQIKIFGGVTTDHHRINDQEFYSWDPHIDWDKFVNFQNYYWLPYGPDVIKIGTNLPINSKYTVNLVTKDDVNYYVFTPDGSTVNPVIKLYRGYTYTFEITSPGNPFSFKTARSLGTDDRYSIDGINQVGVTNSTITFTVPEDAPSLIFYQSETDINLGGAIEILSVTDSFAFDIESELLGKKSFTLPGNLKLSNGMKLSFSSNAIPESYRTGQYYVEGVGTAIRLVPESILNIVNPFTVDASIKFDSTPFDTEPFSDSTGFADIQDYIVINRASADRNPWSRYNRWFHKDVISATAAYNGVPSSLDANRRAVRPIIEFEANLKLFNFGVTATDDVDLIDTYTTDVFSTIEGARGYNIDGITLTDGQVILFTADPDPFVANNMFKVSFVNIQGFRQIHLELVNSATANTSVLVKQGVTSQSKSYWFDGTTWAVAQQKTSINQPPLFDIVDDSGYSYSDNSVYSSSTFKGTTVFSYKVGTGVNDAILGFPLAYQNVSNIGDIVFNFTLATDVFEYKLENTIVSKSIDVGYLVKTSYAGSAEYVNGWQTCLAKTTQAAVRVYKNSNKTNNFDIDIYDDITKLGDLVVKIYVNGKRLPPTWSVVNGPTYKKIVLETDITTDDVLTIRAFSKQSINNNGYYEIPLNLQNNPLNGTIQDFTLGEVINHVDSIIDNIYYVDADEQLSAADLNVVGFVGVFPGQSNLRDLGNVTKYGTKFVQHSGPASLSMYHLTSESNNIIHAIEKAKNDYGIFKRTFIETASSIGIDADAVSLIETVLEKVNKNKPNVSPYYFSDMVPYGASSRTDITVLDYRIKQYPLSSTFTLDKLSDKAVGIYLNGVQLVHGRDYTFDGLGFFVVTATIANDDVITTYEYETTNGCFVPATPTKLGIWPAYEPKLYLDTTLVTPRWMIQGHDGSQVVAYGTYGDSPQPDYRDDLLLELEKRIFNNIKIKYDPTIFDINDIIPRYNQESAYSLDEFNQVLSPNFFKWTSLVGSNFSQQLSYDITNPFTYNYKGHYAADNSSVPGYWRGIYRWLLDTDRPHLCPWEMLGFSIEPTWWTSVYGTLPYTKDNLPMWQDIADGVVREPGKPVVVLEKYAKPFLLKSIPVDEYGDLLSPTQSGLARGTINANTSDKYVFGDVAPVEAAWRRSSHYPFSVIATGMLLTPAKVFGLTLDRSKIKRNLAGQLIYSKTNLRIKPADISLPSVYTSSTKVETGGLINYVVDLIFNYIFSNNLKSYTRYLTDLQTLTVKLSYRVGSFTNKDQFNLILDSKTPLSTGNVFIPKEDFNVFLNKSNPVKKLVYSGIIITKVASGFEVKGYSKTQPYFNTYQYTSTGSSINVGGISESYVKWTANSHYTVGTIVSYNEKYYRATSSTTSNATFDSSSFQALTSLPIIGGATVLLRKDWDRSNIVSVPYGTEFATAQEVSDFILGYNEWLKTQGFVFNDYNNNLQSVSNWETSVKEFLFWTTQNWSVGQDKWAEWQPDVAVFYGSVVRYNGEYYSAATNIAANDVFESDLYVKLDGLSTVGNSVISLSPAANGISVKLNNAVVDDVGNSYNDYELFKVDGTPVPLSTIKLSKSNNIATYSTTDGGIYGASFYLVQHEHIVLINNTTIFNDVIYNLETGYRRERIKISAYITDGWTGGFDIPGFIYDQAIIENWKEWQDYNVGDIVRYQGYYYSAMVFIPGGTTFDLSKWSTLTDKPTAKILPNWTNSATQFTDFYNLDSGLFNSDQQKIAQHLIGYQKRQYLENIIQDDVSEYKFYQGMIREKGTQNVLNNLFNVLGLEGKDSLTFYEEWAVRVGQFGAKSAYEEFEIILDEAKFKLNPQGIIFKDVVDPAVNTFVIQQTPNDIYISPSDYNSNPFPALNDNTALLRNAGHVGTGDVKISLNSLSDIVNQDIATVPGGSYVYCSFAGISWDVYKLVQASVNITDVSYSSGLITLTTRNAMLLPANSYIGISGSALFDGFYKIVEVTSLTSFTISKKIAPWPTSYTHAPNIIVYTFVSHKADSIDNLDSVIANTVEDTDLLWVDSTVENLTGVWKYSPVYSKTILANSAKQPNLRFGSSLAVSANGKISAVGTGFGSVSVYDRQGPSVPWSQRQVILPPFITLDTVTTTVANLTKGNATIAMATASNNMLNCLITGPGILENTTIIAVSVSNSVTLSQAATSTISVATVTITKSTNAPMTVASVVALSSDGTWLATGSPYAGYAYTSSSLTGYKPINKVGSSSGLAAQGVISIYKKDANSTYTLVNSLVSPIPAANENFGASLTFVDSDSSNVSTSLYIGAPGYSSNTGKVYRMDYGLFDQASSYYNPVGSSGTKIAVQSTSGISAGMFVRGVGFTSNQHVISVNSATSLTLSAVPDSTPSGKLYFAINTWGFFDTNVVLSGTAQGDRFGSSIAAHGTTLAIAACGGTNNGYVKTYSGITYFQALPTPKTITKPTTTFGSSIALSESETYLAIGDPGATVSNLNQAGAVYIYNPATGLANTQASLTNHSSTSLGGFGTKVAFMNDAKTIVVYSANSPTLFHTTFNVNGTTVFDTGTTTFSSVTNPSGKVDVYDMYNSTWIFSETLARIYQEPVGYGYAMAVGSNNILIGSPYSVDSSIVSGKVYYYSKTPNAYSWTMSVTGIVKPDVRKIKKACLYNRFTGELLTHLDVIDPLQGKIAGPAEEEIKFKTFYDPAMYSTGTASDVNIDSTTYWTGANVGMLWWDLRSAKFVDNYTNDIVYRTTMWNTLATGASIDVYEWVESKYLPSKWDTLADTPAGLAANISGTSLYGDTAYSVKITYDNISKSNRNTYYFWVKNKKVTPDVNGRRISASDVASLIANPRGQGYTCLALTGTNSLSLVNAASYLSSTEVVLSIEYWTIENTSQNVHSQWKIISNNPVVTIPSTIEQKWIDSLCGADSAGRAVPDPLLPAKLRYGIENRPRQGMFINRTEATKQLVERVNLVLAANQISEISDLTNLEQYDKEPSLITGLYDTVVDTDLELRFASVVSFKAPSIAPQVSSDGKITGVIITNAGQGYLVAPYITVVGNGVGASVRATIDSLGRITGINIIDAGQGYDSDTYFSVRNYSALVHSDTAGNNAWAIYSYDTETTTWSKILTSSYDVRKYWNAVDWYATGYNQFSLIDYAIDTFVELHPLVVQIGQTVKVRKSSSSNWLILEKYADSTSVDWTQSYKVVGIQNGTIQLSANLYNFIGTNVGYDATTYGNDEYDIYAATELRIILTTLKDKILVGELKQHYLDLFFASVKYALSEQIYLDWIFKTSFVRASYLLGDLDQPVNYPVDNLSNFEDYIAEVTPYKTKIREYISNYTSVDAGQVAITDFDLPPVYENGKLVVVNAVTSANGIVASGSNISVYPWKFWADNAGYQVVELQLINMGSGYTSEPTVTIESTTGTGATARAFIANGKVNRVVLLTNGQGYLSAPTVVITGGTTGESAKVTAVIGNNPIRSSLVGIKFDRITQDYFLTSINKTETFQGTGSRLQFMLSYPPEVTIGSSSVTINGIPVLRELFTLSWKTSNTSGYTKYIGVLTLKSAPKVNDLIIVSYKVNQVILNAADRIQYYYDSVAGSLGKDLAQLMSGIDYGGVVVDGLGFNTSVGYDSEPYFTGKWDSFDPNYTDFSEVVAADRHSFTLPYTPTDDTQINVYVTTPSQQVYSNLDGVTKIYQYDNLTYNYPKATLAISNTTSGYVNTTLTSVNIIGSVITMVVGNTTGVSPGMGIIGTGFSRLQIVDKVINATTVSLTTVPSVGLLVTGQSVTFTYNYAGSNRLTLSSTNNIVPNSVITSNSNTFTFNTKVVSVIDANNIVIDKILYNNISTGTAVTFTHSLTDPQDVAIYPSGVLELVNAPPAGSTLTITGVLDPIRLDDEFFETEDQKNPNAIMPTPVANCVTAISVLNYGTYTSIPSVTIESSPLESSSLAYTATVGTVSMQVVDAVISTSGRGYAVGDTLTTNGVTFKVSALNTGTGSVTHIAGTVVTVSSTVGLSVGDSFIPIGNGAYELTAGTIFYVSEITNLTTIKLATTLANATAQPATSIIFTSSAVASTTFKSGTSAGSPKTLAITNSGTFTGALPSTAQSTTTSGNGTNCSLTLKYGLKSISLDTNGFGYTSVPSVYIGTPWAASISVDLNETVFYNGNNYLVIQAGVLDTQAPTHITGDVTYGSAILRYEGTVGTAQATINKGIINIPADFEVNENYKFTFRKSTSDGSMATNDADYDTALSGGAFSGSTLTSALGIAPGDIVVDGDGFVTPTSSPAPEEVVPGQVVDTLAIKVYDIPASKSASIKVDKYYSLLNQTTFDITQIPNSPGAVIVKAGNNILTQLTDYTVDYSNRKVVLSSSLATGTLVTIFSIGTVGYNILDVDYFIGNGQTTEFITKASWIDTDVTSLVYVNGVVASPTIFKTDSTYETSGLVGLTFHTAPPAGALINYIIVSGNEHTFAVTKTERISPTGTNSYTLENLIGTSLPNESNMIVRVDQQILSAPINSYFTIGKNRLKYSIDPTLVLPGSVYNSNILVSVGNTLLTSGIDYQVDISGVTVIINRQVYKRFTGMKMVVSVVTSNGYYYTPSTHTITFAQSYDNTHTIEVTASYIHNVLDVERTTTNVTSAATLVEGSAEYYVHKAVAGGVVKLNRAVLNSSYVWVLKNTTLLVPDVDYALNDDNSSIRLLNALSANDTITTITYGSTGLSARISYMQFKDMLNRVSFKRLSENKLTKLTRALTWKDSTIEVASTAKLNVPNIGLNRPGVIEIAGERIEYFTITGNVLGQLRRGTLGTGVRSNYPIGTYVQDIGSSETIPYNDSQVVENLVSDGTHTVNLGFVPASADEIEVFVSGIRLKKKPYALHDANSITQSNPSGDVIFPAEFTVDGQTSQVTLTNLVPLGTNITVIKRTGVAWDYSTNIIDDDNEVANFIKATPGAWYTGLHPIV